MLMLMVSRNRRDHDFRPRKNLIERLQRQQHSEIRRRFLLHCGSSKKAIENELSLYGIQNLPIDSVAPVDVDTGFHLSISEQARNPGLLLIR
jgi:hypothetical protein